MKKITEYIAAIRAEYETEISFHQQAIENIKKEMEALNVLESSKYLGEKQLSQQYLFIEKESNKPTTRERVLKALDVMPLIFTKRKLHEVASADNNGEIAWSTYGVVFAQLIKEGKLIYEKMGMGSQPSTFRRRKLAEQVMDTIEALK